MAIHVDVLIDVQEREFRKASAKLKREADQLGDDLSDRVSKKFKGVSPQAIKSLDASTDAMVRLRRATADYNEAAKDENATDEHRRRKLEDLSKALRAAGRATDDFTATNERELKVTRQRAQVIGQNTVAFKQFREELGKSRVEINRMRADNADLVSSNQRLAKNFDTVTAAARKTREEQEKYNRMREDGTAGREAFIAQGNRVRDAYEKERQVIADVTTATHQLREADNQRTDAINRNVHSLSAYRQQMDGVRQSTQRMAYDNHALISSNLGLIKSFERASDATRAAHEEHEKYNEVVRSGKGSRDDMIRQSDAVRGAYERERRAIRDTTAALHTQIAARAKSLAEDAAPGGKRAGRSGVGQVANLAGSVVTSIPFVPGGPAGLPVAVGVAATLVEVASVAAAAAQSLWLLPGALAAGAAGMGVLAMATNGFGDAIKDMGDPEKFAIALDKLSPAAQQAALTIKSLVDGPLGDLQNAAQEQFFDGLAAQFQGLSNLYLPALKNMTAQVSGAFNDMMTGVSEELQQTDTRAAIENMMSQIGAAFQNFSPVMPDLVNAFVQIAQVGSEFLPDLATGAANAAQAFADFITEARQSGDLKRWMTEGLDTIKQLADGVMSMGRSFAMLAPIGMKILPPIVQLLEDIEPIMPAIGAAALLLGAPFGVWAVAVQHVADTFGALKSVFEVVQSVILTGFDKIRDALDKAFDPLRKAIDVFNSFSKITGGPQIANIPRFGSDDATGGRRVEKGPGLGGLATAGTAPTREGSRIPKGGERGPTSPWIPGYVPPNTGDPWQPQPVPAPPPTGPDGKKLTDKEILDAAMAGIDPSQFRVDPYAGVPGGAPAGSSPYTAGATPPPGTSPFEVGYYEGVDPQKNIEADRKVQSAAHDLEEDRKKRIALEQTGLGSAEEINDAKWKELEDQWKLQEAQADLVTTQRGTWKKLYDVTDEYNSLMEGLGAGLDADMGISKGLAGMADNFVRFLAAVATAPLMGKLALESAKGGGPERTGSGLMGTLAQQGAFGYEYTPEGQLAAEVAENARKSGTTSSGYSYTSPGAGGGAYSSDAALLSNVPRNVGKYDNDVKDLSQGLVDCASGVEDLVNIMDGKSTVGGSLWTGNAADVLPQMGFQRGMGGPGDFRIGYNSGHMQATLPGGTNVNYGSTEAIHAGGLDGGQGAFDPSFTDHWFRPAGATGGPVAPGTPGAPGAGGNQTLQTPFGSIPIPLPVTIVGGTMPGPTGAPGSRPGNKPGGAAAGAITGGPGGTPGADWDAIAAKESGGNWQLPTGQGGTGGLQISAGSWAAYGGLDIAAAPWQASKEDQIRIAEKILADQGPKAWAGGKNFVPYTGPPGGVAGAMGPSGAAPGGLPSGPLSPSDLVNPGLTPPIPGFAAGGAAPGGGMYMPPFDADRQAQRETHSGAYASFDGVQPWQWGAERGNFRPGIEIDTSTTNQPPLNMWEQAKFNAPRRWDKIVAGWGDIRDKAWEMFSPWMIGRADGGITGRGGPKSDLIPAMLSNGEHVLTAEDVHALGGQAQVYALRNMLHMGTGGETPPIPGAPAPPAQPTPQAAGFNSILGAMSPGKSGFQAVSQQKPQYGGVGSPSIPGGSAASGLGVAGEAATAMAGPLAPAAAAGMALIGRASKYAGQLAGIGVQGLFETFLPSGGSELASNNWLTRIGGAFAGMSPQLPNVAGKAGEQGSMAQRLTPEQIASTVAPVQTNAVPGAQTNNNTGVHIENYVVQQSEDRSGQQIARWNMPGMR